MDLQNQRSYKSLKVGVNFFFLKDLGWQGALPAGVWSLSREPVRNPNPRSPLWVAKQVPEAGPGIPVLTGSPGDPEGHWCLRCVDHVFSLRRKILQLNQIPGFPRGIGARTSELPQFKEAQESYRKWCRMCILSVYIFLYTLNHFLIIYAEYSVSAM